MGVDSDMVAGGKEAGCRTILSTIQLLALTTTPYTFLPGSLDEPLSLLTCSPCHAPTHRCSTLRSPRRNPSPSLPLPNRSSRVHLSSAGRHRSSRRQHPSLRSLGREARMVSLPFVPESPSIPFAPGADPRSCAVPVAYAEAEPTSGFWSDPTTGTKFPTTMISGEGATLQLVGSGVRVVSFLAIRVYAVGFYADVRALQEIKEGKIQGWKVRAKLIVSKCDRPRS